MRRTQSQISGVIEQNRPTPTLKHHVAKPANCVRPNFAFDRIFEQISDAIKRQSPVARDIDTFDLEFDIAIAAPVFGGPWEQPTRLTQTFDRLQDADFGLFADLAQSQENADLFG